MLDTEGETDSSAMPLQEDGQVWPRGSMEQEARQQLMLQRRDAVHLNF